MLILYIMYIAIVTYLGTYIVTVGSHRYTGVHYINCTYLYSLIIAKYLFNYLIEFIQHCQNILVVYFHFDYKTT